MPYFLLALPDTFYLWLEPERKAAKAFVEGQRNALGDTEVPLDDAVPAWDLVRPYLGHPGGRDPNPSEVRSYAMILKAAGNCRSFPNSSLIPLGCGKSG